MVRVMRDVRIIIIFHGFDGDVESLGQYGVEAAGCLQIGALHRALLEERKEMETHYYQNIQLTQLTSRWLGIELDKAYIRNRRWADRMLHPWKQRYASYDVWVFYELYRPLTMRLIDACGSKEAGKERVPKTVRSRLEEFESGGCYNVLH